MWRCNVTFEGCAACIERMVSWDADALHTELTSIPEKGVMGMRCREAITTAF